MTTNAAIVGSRVARTCARWARDVRTSTAQEQTTTAATLAHPGCKIKPMPAATKIHATFVSHGGYNGGLARKPDN